jgi:uncharacterized phage protein (TIGR02220 family)
MARARNLKPSFFTNDVLAEINPLGRLLFQGLWCLADRLGRLEDRPKKIKAELLPYDECNVDSLLNDLHSHGFILRYEVDGTRFIQVLAFSKHQNPHIKEAASNIPAPVEPGALPVQNEESTRKAEELPEQARLIPDSLNPLPDSLNPKEPLSGEPDVADSETESETEDGELGAEVEESNDVQAILAHLNLRAGTRYRMVASNARLIRGRLAEGATVDEIKAVIDAKVKEWKGDRQWAKYLRPDTLFNATKFAQYVGQLGGNGSGGEWWKSAGFEKQWQATNAGCTETNARFYRDGKRIEGNT